MASSEKTERLGLSLWNAADRPERIDFVQDNEQLEELVGSHLVDESVHLTTKEKNFLKMPYWFTVYRGSGKDSRKFTIQNDLRWPMLIWTFCPGKPFSVTNEDGTVTVYSALWYSYYGGEGYSGCGISADEDTSSVTVYNTTVDGVNWRLNEKNQNYVSLYICNSM